jgi:predicted glutamine amidotransferase
MCELLAVTSKKPTTVSMSLDQFASHCSDASANRDGWGIVYYAEDDWKPMQAGSLVALKDGEISMVSEN